MSKRDTLDKKIQMKRINATQEDLEFHLSKQDVETLLDDAGITVEDWSFMGYHLSRYNDEGHYTVGNCRFVPYHVNYAEKKISDKSRESSRQKAIKMNSDHEIISRRTLSRKKTYDLKREEQRNIFEQTAHQSYLGLRNSQYGSYWITNGALNKKWRDELGSIPNGFRNGRVGDGTFQGR